MWTSLPNQAMQATADGGACMAVVMRARTAVIRHEEQFDRVARQVAAAAPNGTETEVNVALGEILSPRIKFKHEYDLGTTTELTLRVVSEGRSEIKGKSIWLLARNDPPSITCESCGKIATQVCTECVWSGEGWLCDECAVEKENLKTWGSNVHI